ncbi:MAG TPA: hypothetical protein VKR58_08800 [Aquella sp.]|nr:hypothetical protein [Aquella sp.]
MQTDKSNIAKTFTPQCYLFGILITFLCMTAQATHLLQCKQKPDGSDVFRISINTNIIEVKTILKRSNDVHVTNMSFRRSELQDGYLLNDVEGIVISDRGNDTWTLIRSVEQTPTQQEFISWQLTLKHDPKNALSFKCIEDFPRQSIDINNIKNTLGKPITIVTTAEEENVENNEGAGNDNDTDTDSD